SVRSRFPRVTPLALVLALTVTGCVTEPDPLKTRNDIRPAALGDGWAVSTPAAEGLDEVALGRAFDLFYSDTLYLGAVSLLVARHGRLVAEGYARSPGDRDRRRQVQSVTKSVTSLVFGIARGRGDFPELGRTLFSLFPEAFDTDPRKREITLRHLLTMTSGIDLDNDAFAKEMLDKRPTNQVRYMLAKPLRAAPGAAFNYRDADPQLLSSAVEKVTGSTLHALARDLLFTPLGITDYTWQANADGTTIGGSSLALRPRDLAKLGQLVLQKGRWQGRQVVPESWIIESTSAQVPTGAAGIDYGYYWWVVPELRSFSAVGHGGQFAFVTPDLDLLIVMTSLPSSDGETVGTSLEEFLPLARLVMAAAGS
ncbi:MAG: serine hydrolase, partial [Gemmatimonadetes bacterium]|nr:serine hydrolase [Gemmatimonadota bacterium]